MIKFLLISFFFNIKAWPIQRRLDARVNSLVLRDSKWSDRVQSSKLRIAVLNHPYGLTCCPISQFESLVTFLRNNHHEVDSITLPNIFELNDKRFERRWLDYIIDFRLSSYNYVISVDCGSSEALLRYMESYPLSYVILTDPFDSYTAGERHGRDYRYSKILENCEGLGIVRSVRSKKIKATIENIYSELRSRVLCMMDGNIETQSTLHLLDPSGVILKSDNLRMITRIDAIKTLSSLVASFLFETNIS